MVNLQTVGRLKKGIQSIISESRSSLSDEDVSLLKECVTFLETIEIISDPKSPEIPKIVSSVVEILMRVLLGEAFEKIKDMLF